MVFKVFEDILIKDHETEGGDKHPAKDYHHGMVAAKGYLQGDKGARPNDHSNKNGNNGCIFTVKDQFHGKTS